jgi:hypothetical protein
MGINWKWNAPVRGVFRMVAGILGALFIAIGVLVIYNSTKAGTAMLGFGAFFLFVAIRDRFVKRDIG